MNNQSEKIARVGTLFGTEKEDFSSSPGCVFTASWESPKALK